MAMKSCEVLVKLNQKEGNINNNKDLDTAHHNTTLND